MLRQRLITAGILGPLVLGGIWLMPSAIFTIAIAIVGLAAALELTELAQLRHPIRRAMYLCSLILGMLVLCQFTACAMAYWLQAATTMWWLVVTLALITRRHTIAPSQYACWWTLIGGGVILLTAWFSMMHIYHHHPNGAALTMFLFILTWMADSAAFFVGKHWKGKLLSPVVSPKKTWAGVFGAMAGASLCGVGLWLSGWLPVNLALSILLCILVALLSVGGDLWESLIKRRTGAKDSGELLPGHGGVLDRVDSMLASAPAFAFGINTLELSL
jgi:phosphatidate cytidylyltransferase